MSYLYRNINFLPVYKFTVVNFFDVVTRPSNKIKTITRGGYLHVLFIKLSVCF